MDPLPFGNTYSMKNIPVPGRKEHKTKTIIKTGEFIKRVRWRAFFAKYGNQADTTCHPDIANLLERKESFSFRLQSTEQMNFRKC